MVVGEDREHIGPSGYVGAEKVECGSDILSLSMGATHISNEPSCVTPPRSFPLSRTTLACPREPISTRSASGRQSRMAVSQQHRRTRSSHTWTSRIPLYATLQVERECREARAGDDVSGVSNYNQKSRVLLHLVRASKVKGIRMMSRCALEGKAELSRKTGRRGVGWGTPRGPAPAPNLPISSSRDYYSFSVSHCQLCLQHAFQLRESQYLSSFDHHHHIEIYVHDAAKASEGVPQTHVPILHVLRLPTAIPGARCVLNPHRDSLSMLTPRIPVDSHMCKEAVAHKIELAKQLAVVLQGTVKPSESRPLPMRPPSSIPCAASCMRHR